MLPVRAPRARYGPLAARLQVIHELLAGQLAAAGESRAALDALARQAGHFQRRADLPDARWRRLRAVGCELADGGYHRYSRRPLLAAARDLAF